MHSLLVPRIKRKLTSAEKKAREKRRRETMTVFIGGKAKRVPRPLTIEGMDPDEYLRRNADPLWLHQNEMWHLIPPCDSESKSDSDSELPTSQPRSGLDSEGLDPSNIPF